jgi:hypothetical protein
VYVWERRVTIEKEYRIIMPIEIVAKCPANPLAKCPAMFPIYSLAKCPAISPQYSVYIAYTLPR